MCRSISRGCAEWEPAGRWKASLGLFREWAVGPGRISGRRHWCWITSVRQSQHCQVGGPGHQHTVPLPQSWVEWPRDFRRRHQCQRPFPRQGDCYDARTQPLYAQAPDRGDASGDMRVRQFVLILARVFFVAATFMSNSWTLLFYLDTCHCNSRMFCSSVRAVQSALQSPSVEFDPAHVFSWGQGLVIQLMGQYFFFFCLVSFW